MRVVMFAIVLLMCPALALVPWLEPLDRMVLDAQFRFLRAHDLRAVATDVVIVGIDDETARLGREVGRGLIDYAAGEAFDYVPLHSVLAWYDTGDTARLENAFGGKAILLGGVFRFEDRLAVPVNLQAWEAPNSNAPGVLLHAQALRNLLNAGLIAPVPRWIVLALCLLMAIGWLVVFDVALAAGAVPVGGIAVLAASTWLLARGSYLPPMAPLLAWTSAVGSRVLCEASL